MKYDVILADPPWRYRAWSGTPYGAGSRTADAHYDTLTHEQIMGLLFEQLATRAADNFALFLWATFPTLPETLRWVGQTGVRYVTAAFTWVKITKAGKPATGLGHYTRANAEPCLLFVGGRGLGRPIDRSVNSVVLAPRGRHSAKPPEVRERIARMYPNARRLELFARDRCDGWDAWGNEI